MDLDTLMAQLLETLQLIHHESVATIWLNRPEVHNAFNATLVHELTTVTQHLQRDTTVRVIVLAGHGKNFCAGADLHWMQAAATASHADNLADAQQLALLFKTLYSSSKPIIARLHGLALGGGTGLAAVADIAIATDTAHFALSEVRLGLIPATIGPYVADAIGIRQARRYFLTAERFDAPTACSLGLVHEVVTADTLDQRIQALADELIKGGPHALASTKSLLRLLREGSPCNEATLSTTAHWIANVRASDEAREGLAAFFAKRRPSWDQEA